MIKIFLFSVLLSHSNIFAQKINSLSYLPTELKLLISCFPDELSHKEMTTLVNNFNESFQYLNKDDLNIFAKTEIYKFIVNSTDYIGDNKNRDTLKIEVQELLKVSSIFCDFSQWILHGIKTDLEQYSKIKNNKYKKSILNYSNMWIQRFQSQKQSKDNSIKEWYLNFFNLLIKKAHIFSLASDKSNQPYVKLLNVENTVKESIPPTKEEKIDLLFKEGTKKDN